MKKRVIDNDNLKYNRYLDLEAKAINTYDRLRKFSEQALGPDKVSMSEMIKPSAPNYLVNEYYELYLKGIYPDHVSKELLFNQQIQVSLEAVQQTQNQFDDYMKRLGKYAPTFKDDAVTSNIKQSDFDVYLNPQKEGFYDVLNNLLDCVEELKEYQTVTPIHLVRLVSSCLVMDGLDVKINKTKFI